MNPELPEMKATVLVIDDEEGQRDMLRFTLPEQGYAVLQAANGDEALEMARRHPFELVICDMKMPGKNGLEVLKILTQIRPDVEVIMATGFASLETAEKAYATGAYDYISKPYSIHELCEILDRALVRRQKRLHP